HVRDDVVPLPRNLRFFEKDLRVRHGCPLLRPRESRRRERPLRGHPVAGTELGPPSPRCFARCTPASPRVVPHCPCSSFLAENGGGQEWMARVLIAGCGYVGTALAAQLLVEGHEVWTLRRSLTPPPRGAVGIRADLTDVDALRCLPPRLDS